MPRVCACCNRNRSHDWYTTSERRQGDGVSRCITFVGGQVSYNELNRNRRAGSARYNASHSGDILVRDLYRPWAEGSCRYVARGRYNSGPRRGELCVIKWSKSGPVFDRAFFTYDIKAVHRALQIVNMFNQCRHIKKVITVNIPRVVPLADTGDPPCWQGQYVLCEPFIKNYHKFNSNSGWYDASTKWGKVMQALSHFSYHISEGGCVLCDLQGGIYKREAIITDPAILTPDRVYGVTDLGQNGIINFFNQHVCNRYCRSHWKKPDNRWRSRPAVTLSRGVVVRWFARVFC